MSGQIESLALIGWIITAVWTLIAAFIIAPTMVWKKIKKHRSTPEDIKADVVNELNKKINALDTNFETKLQELNTSFSNSVAEFNLKVDKIQLPEFPDFQTMIKVELDDQRMIINENLDKLQRAIPGYVLAVLQSKEGADALFEIMKQGQKSLIGAWCRAKGIDEERFQKGVDMTKEWFIENVENATTNAPQKIRAVAKILNAIFPDEGDWVDEKIAALEVLQQNWHLITGEPNGQITIQQSELVPVGRSISSQQVFLTGGAQG